MLTVVFMLAPYYIAWAAVFGELQKIAMASTAQNEVSITKRRSHSQHHADASDLADVPTKDDDGNVEDSGDGEAEKQKGSAPDKKIQLFVILFAIAPIGVVMLVVLDVWLLFEDLAVKPIYLWMFKTPFRAESHSEKGYKKLRRVSEVIYVSLSHDNLSINLLFANS